MKLRLVVLAAVFVCSTAFAGDRSTSTPITTRASTEKKASVSTKKKKSTRAEKTEAPRSLSELGTRGTGK